MKRLIVLASALFVLHISGCGPSGPDVGTVSGTVTIDGKPAEGIRVNFMPVEEGRPSVGVTDENGYYELAYSPTSMGALPGSHTVGITPPEPSVDNSETVSRAPLVDKTIPKAYLDTKKQVEVKLGDNTIDLSYP